MSIQVNPPPQLKLPEALAKDKEAATYFRHLDRMLLQLWKRTGGGVDLLDDLINDVNPITELSTINDKIDDLSKGQPSVVDLSDIDSRILALEEDVTAKYILPEIETGGGEVDKLAPDLTFPSSTWAVGNSTKVTALTDCTGGLTTLISLSGKYILSLIKLYSLAAESTTVKLTIDGVVIWNDTYTPALLSPSLIGGNTTLSYSGSPMFLVESSLLLEVQTITATAVQAQWEARPIL